MSDIPSTVDLALNIGPFNSGTSYISFTNVFAMSKTTKEEAPREFLDYLDPKWKGKIVSTYPNDDDAVLFQ